ncbi:hypothetical protein L7F22_036576 [Adiantum nelumboides]|nr:hypothetical protein [Adiantum nelumboides]
MDALPSLRRWSTAVSYRVQGQRLLSATRSPTGQPCFGDVVAVASGKGGVGKSTTADQFWGCYAVKILPDMCYAAGYRYTWVSFLKLKSEAFGSIRDWKAMVEKEKDLKVKSIRSDRGGEFLSENFARWCKSEGIRRQLATPYTPSQNGVVERKNRTIMEMARAMLAHASLPRFYWAEACNTAVYI